MKRVGKPVGAGARRVEESRATDASAASRQLPVLLHRTREALAVHFRKVFSLYDLTDPQWRVLRILSQSEQIDVADLARRSYLMGPSLSRILKDLTARGLIVREVSRADARRFLHNLSSRGRQLIEEVSPAFNPVFKEIEARLGIERIQELNARLAEVLAAIRIGGEEEGDDEVAQPPRGGRKRDHR